MNPVITCSKEGHKLRNICICRYLFVLTGRPVSVCNVYRCSIDGRRNGGSTGHSAPGCTRDFNINPMGVAWKD